MYSLECVFPPSSPVITPAEVAARLDLGEAKADVLAPFVLASERYFDGKDGYLGRALVTQTWDMYFDAAAFPEGVVRVPLPPMISIEELAFEDRDGTLQVVEADRYRLERGKPAIIKPIDFRLQDYRSFRLRFRCGYGDKGEDIPEPIRQAIVLKAAHLRSISRPDVQLMSETVNGVGSSMWSVSESVGVAYERAAANLVSGYRIVVL